MIDELKEIRRQKWLGHQSDPVDQSRHGSIPSQPISIPLAAANRRCDEEEALLRKVHILPLSGCPENVQHEKTRLESLTPELVRLKRERKVLSIGDVVSADGTDHVVVGAEPCEGLINDSTEFFFEGTAVPFLNRIQFLGISGPRDSGDGHLFDEYVKPYFAGQTRHNTRHRRIIRQDDIIEFKSVRMMVVACEPEGLGVVHADTEIFACWDDGSFAKPALPAASLGESTEIQATTEVDRHGHDDPPAEEAPTENIGDVNEISATGIRDSDFPSNALKKVLVLPRSSNVDEVLNGRSRLQLLKPELNRMRTNQEILRIGDLVAAEGVEFVILKAEPEEGCLVLDTEFFVDDDIAPHLKCVNLLGISGPRESGNDAFLKEYLQPYFELSAPNGDCKSRLRVVNRGDVITFRDAKFVVGACEPHEFGVVDTETRLIGAWDDTPDFQRIHLVPFEHTVPRGLEHAVFEKYLKPYLKANDAQHFSVDDIVRCAGVVFKVICCEPDGPRRIGRDTEIFWRGSLPMQVHMSHAEMVAMSSRQLYAKWVTGRVRASLPVYQEAADSICVADTLMTSSRLGSRLKHLEEIMQASSSHNAVEIMELSTVIAIRKGFGARSVGEARGRAFEVVGLARGNMFQGAMLLFHGLSWEQKYLAEALRILCESEEPAGLQIILGLMRRGADECHARKVYAFNSIISRLKLPVGIDFKQGDSDVDRDRARSAVFDVVTDLIEDIKDGAFNTVFLEPTKMYFHAMGRGEVAPDVDTHGINTYLSVVLATLGVELSRRPFLYDDTGIGLVDFLRAGMDDSLRLFWKEEHFGKGWQSVGELRRQTPFARRAPSYFIFDECVPFFGSARACDIANEAINPQGNHAKQCRVATYIELFASWFSEDFIIPRMITRLIGEEGRPEALRVLRDDLAQLEACWMPNEGEEDVRFWLWDMEVFPARLHKDRALRLLQHAGVVRSFI